MIQTSAGLSAVLKMPPKCILYYNKYLFQNSVIPTGIYSVSDYLGTPKIVFWQNDLNSAN